MEIDRRITQNNRRKVNEIMITISAQDYTTEQLKDLSYALVVAEDKIFKRYECKRCMFCNRECKGYAVRTDLFNAWRYLDKKIGEREALEEHQVEN